MSTYEESIEVDVPVSTAYNQWTLFEEFPKFMEGVESVTQLTDTTNHWVTKIGGVTREFDTRITEQVPDQRIAWCTTDGPRQAGVVTFHRLSDDRSKVMLQMEFDPEGVVESVGDALGFVRGRVEGDLERFREFIEARGREEGGWRGEVPQNETG
jgi:uncharacterized membrane protein